MENKVTHIEDLHFEHKLWKRQLDFQVHELAIFVHRLEEVVSRWSDKVILANVERYQNQFIRHKEVLDTLLHEINVHQDELVKFAKDHPVALDHMRFEDHSELRDSVETQVDIYTSLKKEFMRFLTTTM